MNQERTILRGLLAERRLALQKEEARADGLITALRMLLNPYVEASALEEDKIRVMSRDLCESVVRVERIQSGIARIKEDLDG